MSGGSVPTRRTSWHERATCRGADPDLFAPLGREAPRALERRLTSAAAVCRGCPVRPECAEQGRHGHEWGVWAGRLLAWGRPVGRRRAGSYGAEALGGVPGDCCGRCGRPMVPNGRPVPAGHIAHAARGLCGVCHHRATHKATPYRYDTVSPADPAVVADILDGFTHETNCAERAAVVADLTGAGWSRRRIADRLGLTARTVARYRRTSREAT